MARSSGTCACDGGRLARPRGCPGGRGGPGGRAGRSRNPRRRRRRSRGRTCPPPRTRPHTRRRPARRTGCARRTPGRALRTGPRDVRTGPAGGNRRGRCWPARAGRGATPRLRGGRAAGSCARASLPGLLGRPWSCGLAGRGSSYLGSWCTGSYPGGSGRRVLIRAPGVPVRKPVRPCGRRPLGYAARGPGTRVRAAAAGLCGGRGLDGHPSPFSLTRRHPGRAGQRGGPWRVRRPGRLAAGRRRPRRRRPDDGRGRPSRRGAARRAPRWW